jgi:integrase
MNPLYAAYVLMLVLGLRRGELLGLAWEDVDLVEATAWIGWQVQRVNGGLVRRQTKTYASDAPLPLPDISIRALEHRRQVEARWRAVAPAWHEWGWCSRRGWGRGLIRATSTGRSLIGRSGLACPRGRFT